MYFTILLVVTEFCVILYLFLKLTTSKQKIHLQNHGGIGLPLGAMKLVETEDAGISLGPGLGVSKYTGRKEKYSFVLDCKGGL